MGGAPLVQPGHRPVSGDPRPSATMCVLYQGEEDIEVGEGEIEVDDSILGVRVDDNGKTTVYVHDDEGMVRKYQFPSVDAFKAAEPELYEQVKPLLH